MSPPDDGCGARPGLTTELRALALAALARLDPVLERLHTDPAAPVPPGEQPCAGCPVCAVLAALRGERPELAVRLAEQAAGLVAVLRAALEEGAGGPAPGPETGPADQAPGRIVQRIPVAR